MPSLADTTLAAASRAPVILRHAGIAGLGAALPETVVGSDAIAERPGVPAGWIERRTGIASRRYAADGARVVDLAAAAGAAALADAQIAPGAIDMVLVATLAADELTPNA